MTEMFERCVKVITEAFDKEGRVFDDGQAERLLAAVITAMREPTKKMIEAGNDYALAEDCYSAMIDEILK